MRIVATSDTHFEVPDDMLPDGDVLIVAGDLMYSGYVDEWAHTKRWLATAPHKHKYVVPGNHDFHMRNYEGVARAELRRECGARLITPDNPHFKLPNGMNAMGVAHVTNLPGWAYNVDDDWLLDYMEAATDGIDVDVMITHAPMYKVLDMLLPDNEPDYKKEHIGTLAYNRWFYRRADAGKKLPLVWINGHIHESYGKDNIRGCHFFNVAMCDRKYKQTNPPVVIDL